MASVIPEVGSFNFWALIAGLEIALFVYAMSPGKKFWDKWFQGGGPFLHTEPAAPTAPTWYAGKNISGQIESVRQVDDTHYEITCSDTDMTELVHKDKLVPLNKVHTIAHSDKDTWVNKDAIVDLDKDELESTVQQLKDKVAASELGRRKLSDENKDLMSNAEGKMKKEAQLLGVLRREGSSGTGSPFSPFGSYGGGYRRPYIYNSGGATNYEEGGD